MTEFLLRNWILIVALFVFVALHRSGRGCGMHGHHGPSHAHDREQSTGRETTVPK